MKNTFLIFMTKTANKWVLVAALMILSVCVHAQITVNGSIFVSSNGNDVTGDGSFDKPYATLTGARNHIRGLTNNGANPLNYNMTVYVRGGKYIIDSTFELSAIDSGTEEIPIVYRNYNDEKVIFDASYNLDPLQATKITEPSVKNRIINEAARDKIYQIDLKALGCPSSVYNEPYVKYYGSTFNFANFHDFFIDGDQMNIARYPNKTTDLSSYLMITLPDVVDKGTRVRGPSPGSSTPPQVWSPEIKSWQDLVALPNIKPFKFKYTAYADRLEKWQDIDNVWMGGFWYADWAGEYIKIGNVDKVNKIITSAEPSFYGLYWGDNYGDRPMFYLNILEELDAPGEFFVDQTNGMLYFYPKNEVNENTSIELTRMRDDIIRMNDVSYVSLIGINLTGSKAQMASMNYDAEMKGSGIVMNNSSHITVDSCNVYNMSGKGVYVTGGTNQSFLNMEVHHTGLGGFDVNVGNRDVSMPLFDGNTLIDNCEIYNTGSGKNTFGYYPNLAIKGSGVTVRHCKIYDAVQTAFVIQGNNMLVEYNELFNVCTETSDQGAIYSGRDVTYSGNVIRYNYFHDIMPESTGPYHVGAVFWDDLSSAFKFYGNIMKDVGKGSVVRVNGGVNHEYYHNIVIGGPSEFYAANDNVNLNSWRSQLLSNTKGTLPWETETLYWKTFVYSDVRSAIFIEKYGDWLKKALVDQDFSMIQTSQLSHKFAYSRVEKNVVIGPTNNTGIDSWNLTRADIGQVGFTDIENNDFSIKDYSAIRSKIPDFPALDFYKMGRQKRPAVKPVAENVTQAIIN